MVNFVKSILTYIIDAENKLQHLLLTTLPYSRAKEWVGSFTSTAVNYNKATDSSKSRFG